MCKPYFRLKSRCTVISNERPQKNAATRHFSKVTNDEPTTMETSANKRPLESEQRMDTYAVCTNCSCLSHNLLNCEKCGCPLSVDNESVCYSAEPKRSRPQPTQLSSHSSSANSSSVINTNNAAISGPNVLPTPQSLFLNKNTVSAPPSANNSASAVRPQALFVNLNNQAHAVVNSTGQSIMTTTATSVAPPRASSVTAPSVASSQVGTSTVNSAETRLQRPSESSNVSITLGNIASVTNDHRSSTSTMSSASNGQLVSSNHQSSAPEAGANGSTMEVTINAYQIRIGTRKFVPISPVSFKEDGILFTLKGYTLAPVLLNARAIMICKANLIFCHYPVLFLYLENSCMQQIRNIFQLREDEFSEDTTYALKRCITIFPNVTLHATSTTCILAENIVKIFSSMAKKYPRYNKILEIISPEMSLDMLLAVHALNGTSSTPSQMSIGSNMLVRSATGGIPTHCGTTTLRNMMRATVAAPAPTITRAPVMTAVTQQPSALQQSPRIQTRPIAAPPGYSVYRTAAAPVNSVPPSSVNRNASYPPTLVVPTDPNRWALMQKNLVSGGVYHVKMPTGQPKYCLWDGAKLVPCLVQNTEVQLDCKYIRIGMLKGTPIDQIRVMTDQSSGIYFKLNSPSCGIVDIFLTSDDIQHCYLCSDGNVTAIFVSPTRTGVDKLRSKFKLKAQGRAIVFNPSSTEEHQKHLILFLRRINNDQKDALLQVKHPANRTNLFEMIDMLKAYKIFTKISQSARVQSNINDYFTAGNNHADRQAMSPASLENVVKEITSETSSNDGSNKSKQNNDVEDDDDDDDDDVIMTSEEIGIKCPYTQQVMKEPMRNKLCGHNYEKMAILEFIARKKGNAKCPYAGCGNVTPLRMEDLILNTELKEHIDKQLNERGKTHQTQVL